MADRVTILDLLARKRDGKRFTMLTAYDALQAALVEAGIPVMGHVGLTPQSVNIFGGYKVQGRDARRAEEILEGARALEAAGAFAVVLECVPSALAAMITQALAIPTIGIGAGRACDAQVLVFHDLLGFTKRGRRLPRFVKRYDTLGDRAAAAIRAFKADVEAGAFPGPEHAYEMEAGELEKLKGSAAEVIDEPYPIAERGAPSQ